MIDKKDNISTEKFIEQLSPDERKKYELVMTDEERDYLLRTTIRYSTSDIFADISEDDDS